MINRGLAMAIFFCMGGICSAQSEPILEIKPLDDPAVEQAPQPTAEKPVQAAENRNNQNSDDEPVPYEFPQSHNYGNPVEIGNDQLRIQRGYWLPGGYEPRSGSPYFYSVPGAPPRGPLGGTLANGYIGGNPQLDRYSNNQGHQNYTSNGYRGNGQYTGNGYSNSGNANGPAGDPYQYHFGPGFYRSSEYGHFRFPYYSYRRPWYHPGFAGYNRDTNMPW
ncbi:MAG: hypothetical protein JKY95_05535 [Planctomycetaceae bacterium]|nr:hypothetical protein [Planctomycetaceae bacterium]